MGRPRGALTEASNRREITVFLRERDSVFRVPGFFVEFSSDTTGQIHYYCARNKTLVGPKWTLQ